MECVSPLACLNLVIETVGNSFLSNGTNLMKLILLLFVGLKTSFQSINIVRISFESESARNSKLLNVVYVAISYSLVLTRTIGSGA